MKFIKPVMAVMLLACLLHLPYGYYSLVRFVAMVVFAVLAYQYYKEKNDTLMVTFGAFALLFQPFMKIALGRGLWNKHEQSLYGNNYRNAVGVHIVKGCHCQRRINQYAHWSRTFQNLMGTGRQAVLIFT